MFRIPSSEPDTTRLQMTYAAHGLSITNNIPLPVFIDVVNGTLGLSDNNDPDKGKAFFVVDILGTDDVLIQNDGFLLAPGHGLDVGNYYFLSETTPGEWQSTLPSGGSTNEIGMYVVSTDILLLINNRPL